MYKSFKDMEIWQSAIKLAEDIFELTIVLPKKEDYGLTSQLRRAAVSISSNIAEAFGRNFLKDKINFYYYSRGSITETQSLLEYGKRVKYFSIEEVEKIDNDLEKLILSLNKLIKSLKTKT